MTIAKEIEQNGLSPWGLETKQQMRLKKKHAVHTSMAHTSSVGEHK